MARQPDGKILAASEYSSDTWQLTRLNPDGSLDTSFGVNGVALAKFTVNSRPATIRTPDAIAVQPDGSILVGGTIVEGYGTPALCRFTARPARPDVRHRRIRRPERLRDPEQRRVEGIALRPDGRILLAMSIGTLPPGRPAHAERRPDSSFCIGRDAPARERCDRGRRPAAQRPVPAGGPEQGGHVQCQRDAGHDVRSERHPHCQFRQSLAASYQRHRDRLRPAASSWRATAPIRTTDRTTWPSPASRPTAARHHLRQRRIDADQRRRYNDSSHFPRRAARQQDCRGRPRRHCQQ